MRVYHEKVKAIYIYKLKHREDKWSASITHFDGTRKGGVFYSGEEAHDWINQYLIML
jgi:hypothetical protein